MEIPTEFLSSPMQFRRTITAQWGEDGIIEEIFRRIGITSRYCVEFGAWDGQYLSNTWHLWHDLGWSAILIEGNHDRYQTLTNKIVGFPSVYAINKFVAAKGADSLDAILSTLSVPQSFDILSIDIDGDDYYIWNSLERFHPRVVVIEFNPTIPPNLEIVQAAGENFGASALAIAKLAATKGYGLLGCTDSNCIFVRHPEYESLGMVEPSLVDVFPAHHLTYVITSQDGVAFVSRQPTYMEIPTNRSVLATLRGLFAKPRGRPRLKSDKPLLPVCIKLNQSEGNKCSEGRGHRIWEIEQGPLSSLLAIIATVFSLVGRTFLAAGRHLHQTPQQRRVTPWFRDNGDKTLRLFYNLDENSTVVDLGGYEGQWSSDIYSMYRCSIHIFEPVTSFAENIERRFAGNSKIHIHRVALSDRKGVAKIGLNRDGSSIYKHTACIQDIALVRAADYLQAQGFDHIDLMKINIEGGEYDLLDHLIAAKCVAHIRNIQVQFHDFVPNARQRMQQIQSDLDRTHILTYQYPFVWENWQLRTVLSKAVP
jgi:FkbM family methyltransferase